MIPERRGDEEEGGGKECKGVNGHAIRLYFFSLLCQNEVSATLKGSESATGVSCPTKWV